MERARIGVAVNVLVVRKNTVLLGKRKGAWAAGLWGTPGGRLELGESLTQCAARELKEETGMTARDFQFVNVSNNARGGVDHYVYINLLAKDATGEPFVAEPDRCEEWRWFPFKGLPRDMVPEFAAFLRAYLKKEPIVEM